MFLRTSNWFQVYFSCGVKWYNRFTSLINVFLARPKILLSTYRFTHNQTVVQNHNLKPSFTVHIHAETITRIGVQRDGQIEVTWNRDAANYFTIIHRTKLWDPFDGHQKQIFFLYDQAHAIDARVNVDRRVVFKTVYKMSILKRFNCFNKHSTQWYKYCEFY